MAFGDFARGSHLETMLRRWGGQCCTAVWPAVTIIATTVDRGGSAAIGMRQTEALAACAVRPPREPRRLASACAGRAIATIWRNIHVSFAGRCPRTASVVPWRLLAERLIARFVQTDVPN